jgi:hypothetical protein
MIKTAMVVPAWHTTNQPIKYRILFADQQLASGAQATYWADLPDWLERMYWFYAIPAEIQDNYPQQIWIDNVTVKVIDHAKFKIGVKVVNGSGVGVCRFDIWQAGVSVPSV